jgi:hypothetical protein
MAFNATSNNTSVITWRSVLLVEETGGPGENGNNVNTIVDTCDIRKYIKVII